MLTIKKIFKGEKKSEVLSLALSIIFGWWHEGVLIKSVDDRKLGGMVNPTNNQIMVPRYLDRLQPQTNQIWINKKSYQLS